MSFGLFAPSVWLFGGEGVSGRIGNGTRNPRYVSPRPASTLLLVTYFAATGVACVAAGRSRSSSRLRQVGLALAVVAAATAVYGAHEYFDFGARILADLVISAFLLGIAYWYRRPGAEPSPA